MKIFQQRNALLFNPDGLSQMLPVMEFVSKIISHLAEFIEHEIRNSQLVTGTTQLIINELTAKYDENPLQLNAFLAETLRAQTEVIYKNVPYLVDTWIHHQSAVRRRRSSFVIRSILSLPDA